MVESSADSVKSIYTVTVMRSIDAASFTMASIVPGQGATSTITIEAPFQLSTPQISGNFYIACPNDDGNEFKTRDFSWNASPASIDLAMQLDIPHVQLKTYVRDSGKYNYYQNGRELSIYFMDYHGDVPQCEIRDSESTPIEGANVQFVSTTLREYGKNLLFEPIPLEMLYTDAQKPQVRITINGIDGVCPDFNCDFTYINTDSLITGQTLENGNELTIVGSLLPTEDIVIRVNNAYCDIANMVATESQITCTLT